MSAREYYLISDLHIGGDAELDICEFEPELIAFLEDLGDKGGDIELVIVGDTFGFWELTTAEGVDKLKRTIAGHTELLDTFCRIGERIDITLIPGNHDYELACNEGFPEILGKFNIRLEPKEHITRTVAGQTIWIEHGNQRDGFNRIPHFGQPHITPLGYFVTRHVVSSAARHAIFGKEKWLCDVESVQPNEQIPHWMFSNYFYREMSPILRYGMLPFLLCFGLSVLWFAGAKLEKFGLLKTEVFSTNFLRSFGVLGEMQDIIFTVNGAVILAIILFSIPFALLLWDVKKTLGRYGLKTASGIRIQKREVYRKAAGEVFDSNPDVRVFVYGHTHDAYVEEIDNNIIINTGTWLKKLTRIPAWFRRLPDVYVPSFHLNYFRIREENGQVAVDYETIDKEVGSGLTLLQRLMVLGRSREGEVDIPRTTRLEQQDPPAQKQNGR